MALIYDGILRRKALPLFCFLPFNFSGIDTLSVYEFATALEQNLNDTINCYDIFGKVINNQSLSSEQLSYINSFILTTNVFSDIHQTIENVWNTENITDKNWRYCTLISDKQYVYFCLDYD